MGRSRTSKSLQCSVCGDYASVHKHYGSQTHVCFSCRAFFRRVNKVKKYPESTLCNSFLTQVGSCPITKRTRAHCRSVLKTILFHFTFTLFNLLAQWLHTNKNFLPTENNFWPTNNNFSLKFTYERWKVV